jgi:hypothetical protein
MSFQPAYWLWFSMTLAIALGCQPKIGDECQTSVDCSQAGERLCDITQPGGYCTVFNCEPGGCPEESVCIAYGASLSKVAGCTDANGLSRFQRSFCMANCSSNEECRSGYICADLGASGNEWNATLVDRSSSGKVCTVPASGQVNADRQNDICFGAAAGNAGTSSSPTAGAGGTGG